MDNQSKQNRKGCYKENSHIRVLYGESPDRGVETKIYF